MPRPGVDRRQRPGIEHARGTFFTCCVPLLSENQGLDTVLCDFADLAAESDAALQVRQFPSLPGSSTGLRIGREFMIRVLVRSKSGGAFDPPPARCQHASLPKLAVPFSAVRCLDFGVQRRGRLMNGNQLRDIWFPAPAFRHQRTIKDNTRHRQDNHYLSKVPLTASSGKENGDGRNIEWSRP
jgi:hypothetical protein